MKTLLIVESPSKAKKIGQMLGSDFVVQASGGHIRDLPVRAGENGWDAETLEPVYELTERGTESVKYLKTKAKDCDSVLLATDPDREGEAISWHVAEVLKIKSRQRVKFHEITPSAILKAVRNPVPLDNRLVRAQEARRVIDRLVGWLVSGSLSRAINEKASAGRVQSPSLALVVEREREIQCFVKQQYFGAQVTFAGNPDWIAEWAHGDDKCLVHADAERAAMARIFTVSQFIEREEADAPPQPFDTALLQQAASVALGFDPEITMQIAQKLFEQGAITYHRTDESNLSDDAFAMIANFARQHGLPVVADRRKFKAAAGAQEAHEAIRPTHFDLDTGSLLPDELALYQLIHRRAIASQLADTVYSVRRAVLEADGLKYTAVGRVTKDKGWRGFGVAAEIEQGEEEGVAIPANAVPLLVIGQSIAAASGRVVESWTRAPSRYTKASLIRTLKALGIGRPATYAAAVDGLEKRGYVTLQKRQLVPTDLAGKIYDALTGKFSFIQIGFTRQLEEDLDAITSGSKTYTQVVRGMFELLHRELAALGGVAVPVKRVAATDAEGKAIKCPKCKKVMVLRSGKSGEFFGCSTYPKCNGTMKKISAP